MWCITSWLLRICIFNFIITNSCCKIKKMLVNCRVKPAPKSNYFTLSTKLSAPQEFKRGPHSSRASVVFGRPAPREPWLLGQLWIGHPTTCTVCWLLCCSGSFPAHSPHCPLSCRAGSFVICHSLQEQALPQTVFTVQRVAFGHSANHTSCKREDSAHDSFIPRKAAPTTWS